MASTPRSAFAIVIGGLLMTATLPGRTHGLGLIAKHVIEDLGMDKVFFANLNFWATLIGALFCLPCGWLVDRYGSARVAQVVLGLLAVSVYGMSEAESPAEFSIAMILTRGFGQSMLSIISLALVGKWFGDRIGGAMGLFSVLMSLSMAIATGVLAFGVTSLGWREAWSAQLVGLVALIIPLWFLSEPAATLKRPRGPEQSDWELVGSASLRNAIETPCFWVFALGISFFGFVTSGVSLFSQYVLEERGFGQTVFQSSLVISLLSGMLFNVICGATLKSIPYERVLALGLVLLAMSLGMFPWINQLWHVWLYAILFGAAGGVLTVVYFSVWRYAFGPANLGAIQAAAQIPTVLASAMGPVFVAVIESRTGSFSQVFLATSLVAIGMACVASCIRVPRWEIAVSASAGDSRG